MRGFRNTLVALPLILGASGSAAFASGGAVGPQDIKAVVGLIKYLYAGYENGANERKSFFETVPWDLETGRLIERMEKCERKVEELGGFDFDWPSDSQDPQIRNLSVVYSGSPSPKHAVVRASFGSHSSKVVIDYDMYLYDEARLPRRWGVSNIRIHDNRGVSDLLQTLHQELQGECNAF
jgi:hypothetical protein